jgi:formyltetrahydrofolate deformylase
MKCSTIARLLITCPDQPGIVSAITTFLYHHGANITMLDQHSSDPEDGTFFMRLEFQTPHLDVDRKILEQTFSTAVANKFEMQWHISYAHDRKQMALMVSQHDHALQEILWRNQREELPADITMVISNHPNLEQEVSHFGIPYHHVPVTRDNKPGAEAKILSLLEGKADLIVLARYMQILSDDFVSHYPNKIINIHHSFLPAFAGANPYVKACERGVKLIGATAHYVTADLDEGPIIEQEIHRVSHRFDAEEMKDEGMNVERQALARAVKWHLEDRIIVQGNRTIVFN